MEKLNKISKIFLFISILAGIVWLGSYVLRLFLSYQLFLEEDFVLKSYVTDENISGILYTLLPAFTTTFVSYIIFILTFVLFIALSKISLKEQGWLFIILLTVLITAPFEIYLMTMDYDILIKLNSGQFVPQEILGLIIKRFVKLSGFPILEICAYCAVVFLALFKPLKLKKA